MSLQSLTLHKFKIRGSLKAFVEKNLFWKNAFYFGTRFTGLSRNGPHLHSSPDRCQWVDIFFSICTNLKSSRAIRFVDCSWEWLGWSKQGIEITSTGKGIAGDVFKWAIFWIVLYSPREDSSGMLSFLQHWQIIPTNVCRIHFHFTLHRQFHSYFKRKTSLTIKKIFIRIFYYAQITLELIGKSLTVLMWRNKNKSQSKFLISMM